MSSPIGAAAVLLVVGISGGCRTPDMTVVQNAYDAGDYERALSQLDKFEKRKPRDKRRWELEKSIVQIAAGNLEQAVETLRSVRDSLDGTARYDQRAWTDLNQLMQGAGTLLTDDNARSYEVRDYELQLIYGLLAAVEAARGGLNAQAYSLQGLTQALEIQAKIAEDSAALFASIDDYRDLYGKNPKQAYRLVGFGDFVRATLLEESPTRVDEAERAYVRAFQLCPDYPYVDRDLARVRGETRSEAGTGTLFVLTLTGRGPVLKERLLDHPAEAILLIVKQIWSLQRRRATFPIVTGIRVPELHYFADNPKEVHVAIDGVPAGVTGTLTDIEKTAEVEFAAMHDMIVARAVLRRAIKLAAGEAAKHQVDSSRDHWAYTWPQLLIDLGVALWSSAEKADLRSWSLLPARLQALRIELPPGEHEVQLSAGTRAGLAAGAGIRRSVKIQAGYNTYVIAALPTVTE